MKIDLLDPQIEEKLKAFQEAILAQAPDRIKKLGKILRRRSVFSLHKFLVEHGHAGKIPTAQLPFFMDYLIINRIDLKDMHEEARARLRERTLENQPFDAKTGDYVLYVEERMDPVRCRDCKWFMGAPSEGEKSCVELGGTKGGDFPCYGFTKKRLS